MNSRSSLLLIADKVLLKIREIAVVPLIIKSLGASSLGVYSTVMATIGLLISVSHLGFEDSISRYLHANIDKSVVRREYWTLFVIIFVSSGVFSFLLYLSAEVFTNYVLDGMYADLIRLSSLLFLTWSIDTFNQHFYRSQLDISGYSLIEISRSTLDIVFLVAVFLGEIGLMGLLALFTLLRLSIFLVTTLLIARSLGISRPALNLAAKHLSFGLPLIVTKASNWSIRLSDRYLIGVFTSTASIGVYSAAYGLGFFSIQLFLAPISMILLPTVSSLWDAGENERFRRNFQNAFVYFSMFAIPSIVGVTVLREELLLVFATSNVIETGALIVPIVAVSSGLYGMFAISAIGFKLNEETFSEAILWVIGAFANIVANLVLLPLYGPIAAAFSTLLSASLLYAVATYYLNRHFSIYPDVVHLGKCALASMSIVILVTIVEITSTLELIGTILVGAAVYFALLSLFRGIPLELQQRLAGIF